MLYRMCGTGSFTLDNMSRSINSLVNASTGLDKVKKAIDTASTSKVQVPMTPGALNNMRESSCASYAKVSVHNRIGQ